MKRFFNNAKNIYLTWVLLFIVFCFLIPFLSYGHNGGEEKGLTLLAYAVNYLLEGLFILSILTSFLFKKWFKKYWYVNFLIFIILGSMILTIWIRNGSAASLF